jgi:hypothetical protein
MIERAGARTATVAHVSKGKRRGPMVTALALALAAAACGGSSSPEEVATTTTTAAGAPAGTAETTATTAADITTTTTMPPDTTAPPTTAAQPLRPGDRCPLGSDPDCIDPEGDGQGVYLIGGADCMAAFPASPGLCSDLDGDGRAGYPDSG